MEDIVLFFLLHSTIRESCHSSRTLNLLSAAVSCRLSADCGSLLQPVRLQNHLPFSLDPDVPFIHHHQYPESISSFTTHSFTASSSTMTSRWSLTTLRTLTSSYCARDSSSLGLPFSTKAVQVLVQNQFFVFQHPVASTLAGLQQRTTVVRGWGQTTNDQTIWYQPRTSTLWLKRASEVSPD